MCQTPIKEIKLAATINPNKAGYQSPNFFMEGEKTAGKETTTQQKPSMQTMVNNKGRFFFNLDIRFYDCLCLKFYN